MSVCMGRLVSLSLTRMKAECLSEWTRTNVYDHAAI